MERRRVCTNTHFNKVLAALDPGDTEIKAIIACLQLIESDPHQGARFRYDLFSGVYWIIEVSRFGLVYRFSETEVRAVDIFLGERWR